MHPNAALIERFYRAFQNKDVTTMASCYHPQAQFSDPVFVDLKGPRVMAMWTMLAERGTDLRIEFRDVRADDARGSAHWEARYSFTRTGRPVHNLIDAEFEFKDGKIFRHVDRFDFHRWAAQALGLAGKLLGGTAYLQNKVRAQAAAGLRGFEAARKPQAA